jgi:hypothetical protein
MILAGSLPASAAQPLEARRSLPGDLAPSLDDAAKIRPRAYADGCHARDGDVRARACVYGVPGAERTALLIGDSHALQWLPAIEDIAASEGWRLYLLTKSACPVPRITVTVRGERRPDCAPWRRSALERIEEIEPELIIAASLGRIYELPDGASPQRRPRAWRDAWVSTLRALKQRAGAVVLLGDTPMWREDAVACLRHNRRDIGRCDTPREAAIAASVNRAERDAAAEAGVAFVPTADLVCPDDPCRAVQGRFLVLMDDQHLTVRYARRIADDLLARFPADVLPGAPAARSWWSRLQDAISPLGGGLGALLRGLIRSLPAPG